MRKFNEFLSFTKSHARIPTRLSFSNRGVTGDFSRSLIFGIVELVGVRTNSFRFSIYGVTSFEHIYSDDIYIDKRDKKGIGLC